MEMNLPAFSSDLILIKNVLYQETDARYKGKVVSEAETKGNFSQAFGGKFLKILKSSNIFNCSCYGDCFVVVKRAMELHTCSLPHSAAGYRKHLKHEKWRSVGRPCRKVLDGEN